MLILMFTMNSTPLQQYFKILFIFPQIADPLFVLTGQRSSQDIPGLKIYSQYGIPNFLWLQKQGQEDFFTRSYPIIINQRMLHINILESHTQNSFNPQANQNIVLGVHSFINYLLGVQKIHLSVLLHGNPFDWIHNVLWNQFYSNTLIKDCYRYLSFQGNSQATFIRVNGKNFKLIDCLHFQKSQEIRNLIYKCNSFWLEGFLDNGTIKTISFQFKNTQSAEYDLIFTYEPIEKAQKSNKNSLRKSKSKSILKQTSLNSTQKKTFAKKQPAAFNDAKKKQNKQNNKKARNMKSTITYDYNQDTKIRSNSAFNSVFAKSNFESKGKEIRQNVMSALLLEKDNKLKQFRKQAQNKYDQYEGKIEEIMESHNREVDQLKQQVKEILSKYKGKNKKLRKENQCLNQMTNQLKLNLNKKNQQNQDLIINCSALQKQLEEKDKQNKRLSSQLKESKNICEKLQRQLNSSKMEIQKEKSSQMIWKQKYEGLIKKVQKMGSQMHCLTGDYGF